MKYKSVEGVVHATYDGFMHCYYPMQGEERCHEDRKLYLIMDYETLDKLMKAEKTEGVEEVAANDTRV